jgi:hypothetical protein
LTKGGDFSPEVFLLVGSKAAILEPELCTTKP